MKLAVCLAVLAFSPSPALAETSKIERTYTQPWEKQIGYAQIVRHGDTLYISGVVADGKTLADQMTAIYGEIGTLLQPYGADSSDIVRETIYTRDIEALKAAIPVRKTFYTGDIYPAATWVQVQRLYNDENLIEIEVEVALKP